MKQESMMAGAKLASNLKRGLALLALTTALTLPSYADELPFSISVDGHKVDGSKPSATVTDPNQATDLKLEGADIQVKFDGLGVKPILNVSTFPPQVNYQAGETIRFLASFNYGAWITRGELRIYDRKNKFDGQPYQVIPISKLGAAEWQMPSDAPSEMDYVLRVYDEENRYDETKPLALGRSKIRNWSQSRNCCCTRLWRGSLGHAQHPCLRWSSYSLRQKYS
jgi:hypothetical protein